MAFESFAVEIPGHVLMTFEPPIEVTQETLGAAVGIDPQDSERSLAIQAKLLVGDATGNAYIFTDPRLETVRLLGERICELAEAREKQGASGLAEAIEYNQRLPLADLIRFHGQGEDGEEVI